MKKIIAITTLVAATSASAFFGAYLCKCVSDKWIELIFPLKNIIKI
jgi:hypothetical protein